MSEQNTNRRPRVVLKRPQKPNTSSEAQSAHLQETAVEAGVEKRNSSGGKLRIRKPDPSQASDAAAPAAAGTKRKEPESKFQRTADQHEGDQTKSEHGDEQQEGAAVSSTAPQQQQQAEPPQPPEPPETAVTNPRVPAKDSVNDILRKLDDADVYKLFLQPVTEDIAPDYFRYVSSPMDIRTMRHKNQERLFRSWVDVWNDIMRIFDNARRYNSVDSLAYKEADRLQPYAEKLLRAAVGDGSEVPPGKRRLKAILNQVEQEQFGLQSQGNAQQQEGQATQQDMQTTKDDTSGHLNSGSEQNAHLTQQHWQQGLEHGMQGYGYQSSETLQNWQQMQQQQQSMQHAMKPNQIDERYRGYPYVAHAHMSFSGRESPGNDDEESLRMHGYEQTREERKKMREMKVQQQQEKRMQAKQRKQYNPGQAGSMQQRAYGNATMAREREGGVSLFSTTPEAVEHARPLEPHENRRLTFKHVRHVSPLPTLHGSHLTEPLSCVLSQTPGHMPPDGYFYSLARFASGLGPKLQRRVMQLAKASDASGRGITSKETLQVCEQMQQQKQR